jgi:hypothetical protein
MITYILMDSITFLAMDLPLFRCICQWLPYIIGRTCFFTSLTRAAFSAFFFAGALHSRSSYFHDACSYALRLEDRKPLANHLSCDLIDDIDDTQFSISPVDEL